MTDVVTLNWNMCAGLAFALERDLNHLKVGGLYPTAYPIPRGGLYVAALLAGRPGWTFTEDPKQANIAIDDIIDSGRTADAMLRDHSLITYALVDKQQRNEQRWVTFPWEVGGLPRDAADTVTRLEQMLDMSRAANLRLVAILRRELGIA